jgi:hypothetical protein
VISPVLLNDVLDVANKNKTKDKNKNKNKTSGFIDNMC